MRAARLGLTAALAATAFVSSNSLIQAAVVVDWGGDYLSSAVSMTRTNDNGGLGASFSDTVPWSPAFFPATAYLPPAGKSGTFYGGSLITGPGNRVIIGTIAAARVGNDAVNGDNLNVSTTGITGGAGPAANTLSALYLFAKADFLDGANSQTVSLAAGDTFAFKGSGNNNSDNIPNPTPPPANIELGVWRAVVRQGGQYYISSVGGAIPKSNVNPPTTIKDFGLMTWETYDPATSVAYAPGTPYAGGFSDIEAIGVLVQTERLASSTAALASALNVFTVNATVPEPASLSFLALGGVAMLRRRARADV